MERLRPLSAASPPAFHQESRRDDPSEAITSDQTNGDAGMALTMMRGVHLCQPEIQAASRTASFPDVHSALADLVSEFSVAGAARLREMCMKRPKRPNSRAVAPARIAAARPVLSVTTRPPSTSSPYSCSRGVMGVAGPMRATGRLRASRRMRGRLRLTTFEALTTAALHPGSSVSIATIGNSPGRGSASITAQFGRMPSMPGKAPIATTCPVSLRNALTPLPAGPARSKRL